MFRQSYLGRVVAIVSLAVCSVWAARGQAPTSQPVVAAAATDSGHGAGAGAASTGSLHFLATRHDFGKIKDENGPVLVDYAFTNTGSAPVTIKNATSTCGCTVPTLDKKVYAPGEKGSISVSFNPEHRQGRERKIVTVETDDPSAPKIELLVDAEVIPRIAVEPMALYMGETAIGQPGPARQIAITARVAGFALGDPAVEDARFTVKLAKTEPWRVEGEDATRYTYEVGFKGDQKVCRAQTQVVIQTSDSKKPKIYVPLICDVHGELRVVPDRFYFRTDTAGDAVTQEIRFWSRSGKPFHIVGTEFNLPTGMTLNAEPSPVDAKEGGGLKLVLKGTAPATSPSPMSNVVTGTVKVKTDLAEQAEIEIPFTGVIPITKK